jgi:hypothetical protein
MIKMYIGLQLFLSYLNETEFSRQILKNTQISNFIKIRPLGPDLLHVDGQGADASEIAIFTITALVQIIRPIRSPTLLQYMLYKTDTF